MAQQAAKQWSAIVLAGQRPGVDPLAAHFGQQWKALVPLHGRAMIEHVLATLRASPQIAEIVIVAQDPAPFAAMLDADPALRFIASSSGISGSIRAVLERGDVAWPVLITTADHPLLTPAMIADFCSRAEGDLSIGMVARTNMLAQFPDAQRTWLKFSDDGWSGANLFGLQTPAVLPALDLWAKAEAHRKQAFRLFLHFGPVLALLAILRLVSMPNAIARAGAKLGLRANLIAMRDPVAAIDVDKPADHALAVSIITDRRENSR